jgi:DNA-binding FadR family transcriptional regulator
VARDIEMDIIQKRLVAGDWVGSESELMERYGVSRGVVREAITLVEHHMQAETRRGAGGGLVVVEPNARVITEIASLYLARKQVSVAEVFETRLLLETKAIEDLIAGLDDDKAAALLAEASRAIPAGADIAEESERFHLLLAELTGNGVLGMLTTILSGLVKEVWTAHHRRPSSRQHTAFWKKVTLDHRGIAEAVTSGDVAKARLAARDHLFRISTEMLAEQRTIAPLEMALNRAQP